ncbi:MAG: hypothetical protein RL518_345 [Pseudomonadota bacterium]|jgi:hypothetical protein
MNQTFSEGTTERATLLKDMQGPASKTPKTEQPTELIDIL